MFKFFEKIALYFAPSPVHTSIGPARITQNDQEIAIYQPVIFSIINFIGILAAIAGIGVLVFYILTALAQALGAKFMEKLILTTFSSGLIGLGMVTHAIFNRTISKIYIVDWQKYLYFNASFGVVTCAPLSQVTASVSGDGILTLVMNDIETFIDLNTIGDQPTKARILNAFQLA